MPTYKELIAQRQALEAQIAEAHNSELADAVSQVKAIVSEYGLTSADIFEDQSSKRGRKTGSVAGRKTGSVAAKYRDPASGKTWSGRGKPPLWIAGKDREPFAIQMSI